MNVTVLCMHARADGRQAWVPGANNAHKPAGYPPTPHLRGVQQRIGTGQRRIPACIRVSTVALLLARRRPCGCAG